MTRKRIGRYLGLICPNCGTSNFPKNIMCRGCGKNIRKLSDDL